MSKIKKNKIMNSIMYKHLIPKDFTLDDMEEFIDTIDEISDNPTKRNAALHPRTEQGIKGFYQGVKYDSMWEVAFLIYKRDIEGVPIERNRDSWLPYTDRDGKPRRFFPDFIVAGEFWEVKGFYRESDMAKMEQCPEVHFIDKTDMTDIMREVNKRFPTWKSDYMPLLGVSPLGRKFRSPKIPAFPRSL